jgi:plastocyanin
MKKNILFFLFAGISLYSFSTTWQIVNSGYTFSPSTLTIQQGDDVNFSLASIHDAVEVSQSVWNAGSSFPIIGFTVPFGGGNVSASELTPGIHYYVCEPHASLGMKGQIIVQSVSGLTDTKTGNTISVYPNPVVDHLNIQIDFPQSSTFEVTLFDTRGKMVSGLIPKSQVSGMFSQSFNFSNQLTPGIYILKLSVGKVNSYKKIIVL